MVLSEDVRVLDGAEEELPGTARTGLRLGIVAGTAGLCALAASLSYGGALRTGVPWLDGSGGLTHGGLPLAELVREISGAVAVGLLLAAAVLLPGTGGAARWCLAAARPVAALWAVAALVSVLLSVSYLLGKPASRVSGSDLLSFVTDLPQGRALVLVAVLAAFVSAAQVRATALLAVALAGLLPPVLTGHAMTTGNHALAVFALAVHVVAASVWVGGLVALVLVAYPARRWLAEIVPRYSTLALLCFTAVLASGVVNAWLRLDSLDALYGSSYGVLVLAKGLALGALAAFGLWHRRVSIPALHAGRALIFVRVASAEVVLMAAAMALAMGLSRTPPPGEARGPTTPAGILLGFDPPGPPSIRAYALNWWPDPLFTCLTAAGAVLYLMGVLRLRRRGEPWPLHRALTWLGGLTIVLVATGSGLARYSMLLFSAHIVQHLTLTLIAPVLLLAGAPATLARQALNDPKYEAGRSLHNVLKTTRQSRPIEMVLTPLTALAVTMLSLYAFYATPLFEMSLRNHPLHSAMMACFLIAGIAFTHAARTTNWLPMAALPFHLLAGLAFLLANAPLAPNWYAALDLPWGATPVHDQQTAAILIWTLATLATTLTLRRSPEE